MLPVPGFVAPPPPRMVWGGVAAAAGTVVGVAVGCCCCRCRKGLLLLLILPWGCVGCGGRPAAVAWSLFPSPSVYCICKRLLLNGHLFIAGLAIQRQQLAGSIGHPCPIRKSSTYKPIAPLVQKQIRKYCSHKVLNSIFQNKYQYRMFSKKCHTTLISNT